ncbi:MAG: SPW repeat protein [Betaproteobacteria bacterium]|nr:SPW repeat protein [Betaproteobacteria bacterium]
MTTKRWQDWVDLVLGLWLFVSPWVLGFATGNETAAWNMYVMGTAIVVFSAVAVYMPRMWEEWVNMAIGVWLILSPYVLGFHTHMTAALNAVILGVLVTGFATWAMMLDKELAKWWHDRHST